MNSVDLVESQAKKNRPKDTNLRQQKLLAWQPILTAKTVIPIVFCISILFIPIGIVLLQTSRSVKETAFSYVNDSNNNCLNSTNSSNPCIVDFTLEDNYEGDVYFYYGIENYFQNHRRYMKSRNDDQLLGVDLKTTKDCTPFETINNHPIAPCGAIANSLFNDSFVVKFNGNIVPLTYDGLVWPADLGSKFKNPKCNGLDCKTIGDLCDAFKDTVRPPNWRKDLCMLDNSSVENSGFQNADFIIWMRTAALPDFRKPYRKLDRTASPLFVRGLPAGTYTLEVQNNYNVSAFGGKKWFIVSSTSWMGGKNPFLGIAYVFVGVLCAILGVVFIIVHLRYGHTLQEIAGVEHSLAFRTQFAQ